MSNKLKDVSAYLDKVIAGVTDYIAAAERDAVTTVSPKLASFPTSSFIGGETEHSITKVSYHGQAGGDLRNEEFRKQLLAIAAR